MKIRTPLLSMSLLLLAVNSAYADEQEDMDRARDALTKQDNDADTERALEQVFEAAEKNYSLLKRGGFGLNYNFDYSYYGDQRIDLTIERQGDTSVIRNADVSPVASHTFTNSFSLDYGLADNITVSGRLPLVAKYETEQELSAYGIGDLSGSVRWQPFEYIPGKLSQTFFGSLRLPTGVSPYEIDEDETLSTGSGTWGLSGGWSVSKVLDPVVLFGSLSGSYSLPLTGLNQVKGDSLLREVNNGLGLSFSMGFAYSLSYDVSLSASFQGSYNYETEFVLFTPSTGTEQTSTVAGQMSGLMNFALGIRVSPKTIANVNVGFGMTELSPDILLGLSLPIDISAVKPSEG
ncbi:MAG: transporter [Oleibacter sp.]|nr:transporter [Thalassolituus sp.]